MSETSKPTSVPLGAVYWEEEPERERVVLRGCPVCGRREHPINDLSDVMIVSPRGVAHHSDGWGVTICGRDATGENWWWRL